MLSAINISNVFDFQIIVTITMLLATWKWGDWKNWRLYHSTMLFFIVISFFYSLLTYNYPLWQFESPLLKVTFSNILITCVFFPASLLIYLYHFPNGLKKQILYIFLWVGNNSIIEMVSYKLGFISYHHGWTIWLSVLFNCAMYPLFYVHHKKPLWAIYVSLISVVLGMIYWKIPISSMK